MLEKKKLWKVLDGWVPSGAKVSGGNGGEGPARRGRFEDSKVESRQCRHSGGSEGIERSAEYHSCGFRSMFEPLKCGWI